MSSHLYSSKDTLNLEDNFFVPGVSKYEDNSM